MTTVLFRSTRDISPLKKTNSKLIIFQHIPQQGLFVDISKLHMLSRNYTLAILTVVKYSAYYTSSLFNKHNEPKFLLAQS
jgi:hypothetical protein